MVPHQLGGLRAIRRHRRLQRIELASAIGVEPSSYTRFERGERRIYWDKVTILADRLGVHTDDFRRTLNEDDAARLCDQRDKAAIVEGTFRRQLWDAGTASEPVQAAPGPVPPPPSEQSATAKPESAAVPPPPPVTSPVASIEDQVKNLMEGWDDPS